jgi:hypothetical protein
MALTTTSSFAAPGIRTRPRDLCALVCAASAGVHGALVVPHAHESVRLAVAFAAAAVALAIAAVGLVTVPARTTDPAVALLLTVALAYLLSRTSGLPVLAERPEPLDPVGAALTFLEAAAAAVALRSPNPRRHR